MLTSTQNPTVKHVRGLQERSRNRRKAGAFVVEGVRLIEEALQSGWQTQLVLHTSELDERGAGILDAYRQTDVEVTETSPEVMKIISDTQTPQGILAVLSTTPLDFPKNLRFVLILDNVRDPGNLGTMLRTALAAGVDGVLLPPGNVDVFSPKVVRAAMGAHFRLPMQSTSWADIKDILDPLNVFLADALGKQIYNQVDFTSPSAVIIGGEADGAGPEARSLAAQSIQIPMPGGIESLNAAIAGSIVLFEVVRQRQKSVKSDLE
jgi:RNA methyltransferase, TrmH family